MTFKFPLIELVDRYCIAKLKMNKLQGANKEEFEFYSSQLQTIDLNIIKEELDLLYKVHERVWDLEDDFKKYRVENLYNLEEIGRRALHVRDILQERYDLKNKMAEKLGDPVKEIKKYG